MYFENTKTGEFGLTLNDVRRSMSNVSIPENTTEIGDFVGYVPVARPFIDWNQDVAEGKPVDGKQTWVVTTAEQTVLQQRIDQKTEQVRSDREPLLRACDWTQLADVPLSATKIQEWCDYRQALRDVPKQPGFPWTIMWPTEPAAEEASADTPPAISEETETSA